jgi:hypothetical protein
MERLLGRVKRLAQIDGTTLVLMIGSVNAAAQRPSYIFLCGICQWVQRRLKWSRVR